MTEAEFLQMVQENSVNAELLLRLRSLELPECHLTAGCLFQTVWNKLCGRDMRWGVKDYDVFYFDDADTSRESEDQVIRRVSAVADLAVNVEIRNQARVHLWHPDRFGGTYPKLRSARDGIDRYLVFCTRVGVETQSGTVYAPNEPDQRPARFVLCEGRELQGSLALAQGRALISLALAIRG